MTAVTSGPMGSESLVSREEALCANQTQDWMTLASDGEELPVAYLKALDRVLMGSLRGGLG